MKKKVLVLGLLLLTALFFALFIPYTYETELYTPRDIPGTAQNQNPGALREVTRENSVDVISLMQGLIDLPGTIIVDVNSNNMDDAKDNLDAYRSSLAQFDRLVVILDMTQSEIDEFRKNSREELGILENLTEELDEMEELQSLQIQYQDSDDPDKYYSVTYDMEKLKEKIEAKKAELLNVTGQKIKYGTDYDLAVDGLVNSSAQISSIGSGEITEDNRSYNSSLNLTVSYLPYNYTTEEEPEPQSGDYTKPAAVVAAIAVLAGGGIYYYNKRKKRDRLPHRVRVPAPSVKLIQDFEDEELSLPAVEKDYPALILDGREAEAFRLLSKTLFYSVSGRTGIVYRPSMTNNEYLSMLPEPMRTDLIGFTSLYERVVYAPGPSDLEKKSLYAEFMKHMEAEE